MAASAEIVVRHEAGLHARPAAVFVKTAAGFAAKITVENLTRGTPPANAKSMIGVLSAAVGKNNFIRISADGDDALAAVGALCGLIESNFGEPG